MSTAIDWAAWTAPAAIRLLGEPTSKSDDELRFRSRGSLTVTIRGKQRGLWYDHEAGEGGGCLDLIRRERGVDKAGAIQWLRDELRADIPERGRPRAAEYARELATRMKPLAGTPAEAYLVNTRRLAGPFPADLGYHPHVRAKAGGEHPALLCVARDAAGAVVFVHAVFLDGERKAAIEPAKQTWGRMEGAAVRIPAADPSAGDKVILAEGLEDALSWAQATGLEAWACCGIANIGKAEAPKGAEVIVAAQNDPADKEATKALHRAVRRLRGRGYKVVTAPPPDGVKDANDLLREAGAEALQGALAAAKERAGWRLDLIHGPSGGVLPILANAVLAIGQDDAWHGVLGYDEFANAVTMRRPAPWLVDRREPFAERQWGDNDDLHATLWLQKRGVLVSHDIAARAVQNVARERPFHPVREWLDGLAWDGTQRLDRWLVTYLGADDTAYTRAVGSKWMIAAAARIHRPGCKVDTCLILEGPQGLKKSTALRTLFGAAWFSDQMPDLGTKDSMLQVQGKWLIELAELDSLSRGDVSRVKAFMSTQVDRFREPYGKRPADHPRQCIFAGSINPDQYLRDETGGRRFWPVRCGAIDVAALERDRGQLWAEAVARFKAGEAWWLDTLELNREATDEQAARFLADPWEERVAEYVAERDGVTIVDILSFGVGLDISKCGQIEANRVGRILRRMGWTRRRGTKADPVTGKRPLIFEPPPEPREDVTVCEVCGQTMTQTVTPETAANSMACHRVTVCHRCSAEVPREKTEKTDAAAEGDFSPFFQGKFGDGPQTVTDDDIPLNGKGKEASPSAPPNDDIGANDDVPPAPADDGAACDYCGEPAKGGSRMHISCRWKWLRDRKADDEERTAIQEIDGDEPLF